MNACKIEPKIKPADQPLQDYQSGKADDFEVLCRNGEKFGVHLYCLFNSDFLYKQYVARRNFEGEGKGFEYMKLNHSMTFNENKRFDWSLFRKDTVKIYFDALYGVPKENMATHQAIEFVALLHFDAKIDQKSRFETDMQEVVIDHLKNPEMSPRTLALCWLYCQVHSLNPLGQFIKPILADVNLWIFDQYDLKDAVTLMLLKDLNEKNEDDLELKKLISMQFENDSDMKTWAMNFYDTEAQNVIKRVSRQPIFISVDSQDSDFNILSGKYKFHGLKNNAAVFIREGRKIEKFSQHPYFFAYYPGTWVIQGSEHYKNDKSSFWVKINTKAETDYLSLDTNWQDGDTECQKALLNIFDNEDEFDEFNDDEEDEI